MQAKRFNDYSSAELLALDNETVNDAIRIEAIQQGVEPPIPLSDALRRSEWRGYMKPAEAIAVYEIVTTNQHGSHYSSGVGYLDEAKAESALDGMVCIDEDRYSNDKGWKIRSSAGFISKRLVGVSKSDQAWAKLEEFKQNDEAFQEVSDACVARLSEVRQEDYNRRVNAEKKAEYLRLSGGNKDIAKGFWLKVEKSQWPE